MSTPSPPSWGPILSNDPAWTFLPGTLCTDACFAPLRAALDALGCPPRRETTYVIDEPRLDTAIERALPQGPPSVLVGFSLGGILALNAALQSPERVAGLILLDTTARADPPQGATGRRELLTLARNDGMGAVIDRLWPACVAPRHRKNARLRTLLEEMASEVGIARFACQTQIGIERPDIRDRLNEVSIPTLVIVGAEDVATPYDRSREIATLLPNAELASLEGCGHFALLEDPDAMAASIAERTGLTSTEREPRPERIVDGHASRRAMG